MDRVEKKLALMRGILAIVGAGLFYASDTTMGLGWALFLLPLIACAIYVWLGVAQFFIEMIWKLVAQPEERLFASIMLGGTVMVTAVLLAAYWLIQDSIGLGASIMYALGAYAVFSIVRWFRRHTASYYRALEENQRPENGGEPKPDE